jgi:uncharacterized coiled-coil DUF342 family protein
MKTLTVLEYAQQIGVSPVTVYRRIDRGELQAITEDNVKKVVVPIGLQVNSDKLYNDDFELQSEHIDSLKQQIEELKGQNTELRQELQETRQRNDELIRQMQQDSESSKERSDTIILQLTQQNEQLTKQNQLLLEDLRPKKSFFKRLFAWNGG